MYRFTGQPNDTPTRFQILGYPDKWSVHPGDAVSFMLSCDGISRYCARIVRVISGDNTIGGPGFKVEHIKTEVDGEYEGRRQIARIGSFGVAPGSQRNWWADAFSFSVIFEPTKLGEGAQALLTSWSIDDMSGVALVLNHQGCLEAWIGNRAGVVDRLTLSTPVPERQWCHAVLSFDPESMVLTLRQMPARRKFDKDFACQAQRETIVVPFAEGLPLSFAGVPAHNSDNPAEAEYLFNGKLEAPTILVGALSEPEVECLRRQDFTAFSAERVIARWDFSRPDFASATVLDVSAEALHAHLVNLPTRAVTGVLWSGDVMDWKQAPEQYSAIHFHDDDLETANWKPDLKIVLPKKLKSGVYALHVQPVDGPPEEQDYITFFVSPRPGEAKAKVAMLASTYTYLAYSNLHILSDDPEAEYKGGYFLTLNPEDIFLNEHREIGLSLYDRHSDGSGVHFSSRLRPIFSMRLRQSLWSLNIDTLLIDWLEAEGRDYDLITDEDIHVHGEDLLAQYSVLVTGAHPEYWTTRMLDALQHYTRHGGNLMYLGGNGFYWRIAVDPARPWIMEVRRTPDGIRFWEVRPGEDYQAINGEYGGLWRRIGRAPQSIVGIGTVATGFDSASPYRLTEAAKDPRVEFIFRGIDADTFGATGLLGGAAGGEIDASDSELGTPAHALVLARSINHSRFYHLAVEETPTHHMAINGEDSERCRAEIVFFENEGGGAVFSVGSCNWLACLYENGYRNAVSTITRNVLNRFEFGQPFSMPGTAN